MLLARRRWVVHRRSLVSSKHGPPPALHKAGATSAAPPPCVVPEVKTTTNAVAFPSTTTSWYQMQMNEGVMHPDDINAILAYHVAYSEERLTEVQQRRTGTNSRSSTNAVALVNDDELLASTATDPSALAVEVMMQRSSTELLHLAATTPEVKRQFRAIASSGGFVGAAALRWATHAGKAAGRWAEAVELLMTRVGPRRVSVDGEVRELLLHAAHLAAASNRITKTTMDGLRQRTLALRALEDETLPRARCVGKLDANGSVLLEYLRSHSNRRVQTACTVMRSRADNTTDDVLSAPIQHCRPLIEAAVEVLMHAESTLVAQEAQAHGEFLLNGDIASACHNWRAVCDSRDTTTVIPGDTDALVERAAMQARLQATAVPLAVSSLLVGDIGTTLAAFRSCATAEALATIRDAAVGMAELGKIGSLANVNRTFAQVRARCGLRSPPGSPLATDATWIDSLRQVTLSCSYSSHAHVRGLVGIARATEANATSCVLEAVRDAVARTGTACWEFCLAHLAVVTRESFVEVDALKKDVAALLCDAGLYDAAAASRPYQTAVYLWERGAVEDAMRFLRADEAAARFDELLDSRADGVSEWHAALAVLSRAARASQALPPEKAVWRTLKAFAAPDAPKAAVDVLVRLHQQCLERVGAPLGLHDGRAASETSQDNAKGPEIELHLRGVSIASGAARSEDDTTTAMRWTRVKDHEAAAKSLALVANRVASSFTATDRARRHALHMRVTAGEWESALQELQTSMLPMGVKPAPHTLGRLQAVMTDAGQGAAAVGIGRRVASQNVGGILQSDSAATVDSFRRAISSRRWAAALTFVGTPAASNDLEDLLRLCVQSGTWVGACCALSTVPDVASVNTALLVKSIGVMAREGRWREACALFLATDSPTRPGRFAERCLTFLAKACRVDHQWRQSLRVFREVSRRGNVASFTTLAEVVAACLGAGFPLTRVQLWLRVDSKDSVPQQGIALSAAAPTSETAGSIDITSANSPVGVAIAFALLAAQGRGPGSDAWARSLQLVSTVAAGDNRGVLTTECLTSVMDTCCRAERWKQAFSVFQLQSTMKHAPPNRHAIHMLMSCWKHGQWQAALGLYTVGLKNDAVDGLVRDRVVEALCYASQWKTAIEFVLTQGHGGDHAWARIALVPDTPVHIAALALARMSLFPVRRNHRLGQRVEELLRLCPPGSPTRPVLTRLLRD